MEPRKDKIGRIIPDKTLAIWDEAASWRELADVAKWLEQSIEWRVKNAPQALARVNHDAMLADAINLRKSIGTVLPHAVCPTCHGKLPEGCLLCGGRGFVSRFMWEKVVPEETKTLVTNAAQTIPTKRPKRSH